MVWPTAGLPVTGCALTGSDLSDPDPLKPSVTNSLIANLNDTVSLGLFAVIWSIIISTMLVPVAVLLYAGYYFGKRTTRRLVTD